MMFAEDDEDIVVDGGGEEDEDIERGNVRRRGKHQEICNQHPTGYVFPCGHKLCEHHSKKAKKTGLCPSCYTPDKMERMLQTGRHPAKGLFHVVGEREERDSDRSTIPSEDRSEAGGVEDVEDLENVEDVENNIIPGIYPCCCPESAFFSKAKANSNSSKVFGCVSSMAKFTNEKLPRRGLCGLCAFPMRRCITQEAEGKIEPKQIQQIYFP